MRAERFGSYSIVFTVAGTPVLFRLKSIFRYRFLWPFERKREVMRPLLLRPAVATLCSSRLFSGSSVVMSPKSCVDMPRRPGEVGLY